MSKGKKLETEVVLCEGKTDIFKEVLFTFSGQLPIFVEDVNVKLQKIQLNVAGGKCCNTVIFSGELFINVIYKNIDAGSGIVTGNDGSSTVNGDVRHQTKIVPISGCIPVDCKCMPKCDKNVMAKLVDVCISESHMLTGPNHLDTAFPTYSSLREQVCILIKAKVVTDEIITINFEDEDKCDKCDKCDKW